MTTLMPVKQSSTFSFAKREAGGKGFSLYTMTKAGWNVPRWIIFGHSYFDFFHDTTTFSDTTSKMLERFDAGLADADKTSEYILDYFMRMELPDKLHEQIQLAYKEISNNGKNLIAVRSSAVGEDGGQYSFAGQYDTFLEVDSEEMCIGCVLKCWASLYSARALAYRKEHSLLTIPFKMAVVLQELVSPNISGVLFTVDPTSESSDSFVVSHIDGYADKLVAGEVSGTTSWLSAIDSSLKEVDEAANVRSLSDVERQQLVRLGKSAVAYFNRPQDIEWAICDGTVYVLQTRPVTVGAGTIGYRNLWDNSNIIESYGGTTLPLSFSYALCNYRSVYRQFCQVLLIPERLIEEMSPTLNNMLGCINGRIYYNLYNWYRLVSLLPFFRANSQFMETMMGVRTGVDKELLTRLSPHQSLTGFYGFWRRCLSGLALVWYHLRIDSMVLQFQHTFSRKYRSFIRQETERMRYDQLYESYLKLESDVLANWHLPIINDFLCMIHFGFSKSLCSRWLSGDEQLHNELVSGGHEVESMLPALELERLASVVRNSTALMNIFSEYSNENIMEGLVQNNQQEFYDDIQSYLDTFGFRCPNEMKIEAEDLFENPGYLFACIRNQLSTTRFTRTKDTERTEHDVSMMVTSLSTVKRALFSWAIHHTRKAVRNRELLRLDRSRAYGIARRLLKAMGRELASSGVIQNSSDVHYLTLDELRGMHNGTLSVSELGKIAALRKQEYEDYTDQSLPDRFETFGPVYISPRIEFELETAPLQGDSDLQGIPCSPGIVEGIVRVLDSVDHGISLNGEILVAKRTDPGWVPLYPTISGLLVEHGSLLSHSAIVAREMGIPAIVKIPGLVSMLQDGDRVRFDGKKGTITLLSREMD